MGTKRPQKLLEPGMKSHCEKTKGFFNREWTLMDAIGAEPELNELNGLNRSEQPRKNTKNAEKRRQESAFNRISSKHLDFLLCDKETIRLQCAVELDDKSHTQFERGFRDSLVDTALAQAAIPVLRVPAKHAYAPSQLKQQILALIRMHNG